MLEKVFVDYEDIKNDNERIYAFCDENEEWVQELEHLYLHKSGSELYVVISLEKTLSLDEIENIIDNWETRVISYFNFYLKDKEKKEFLKYNTTLLLILKCEKAERYDERCEIIKEEKSTQICRKIFLFSDENGNVNEDELKYLPFYIQTINIEQSLKDKNMSEKAELLKLVREAKEILESYNKNEEKNI